MVRGEVEREFRASFEEFLEEASDVMQLYYADVIPWSEGLKRLYAAADAMRGKQSAIIAGLAQKERA